MASILEKDALSISEIIKASSFFLTEDDSSSPSPMLDDAYTDTISTCSCASRIFFNSLPEYPVTPAIAILILFIMYI